MSVACNLRQARARVSWRLGERTGQGPLGQRFAGKAGTHESSGDLVVSRVSSFVGGVASMYLFGAFGCVRRKTFL